MALVSMKRSTSGDMVANAQPNPYGYGLCLQLDDEQCEALGIKEALRAGQIVTIRAQAYVDSATESVDRDGDDDADIRLSLQITDMEISKVAGRGAAKALYGGDDGEEA